MKYIFCTIVLILQFFPLVITKTTFKPIIETNRFYRLIFNNLYNDEVKNQKAAKTDESILNDISTWFGLSTRSFDNLKFVGNKEGRTVVEFRLKSEVHYTISEMHKNFETETQSPDFKLLLGTTSLQPLVTHCFWEEGQSLYDTSCVELSVKTTTASQDTQSSTNNNNSTNHNLLALLVIPIVIIIAIVVIACLWFFKYKPRNKTDITLSEMGYVQNVSKVGGTVSGKSTGLSMANSAVRNEVYTTMGKSFGFSIDNADFSKDNADDTPNF